MLIYGIFLTIFILLTSVTYYKACINPAEEFTYLTSIKTLGKATLKGVTYGGFFLGLNTLYEVAIPIIKSHGIEFNDEREQLGLSKIGDDWKSIKYQSDQFTTCWRKMESTDGHFKKVIEYGIFTATSETDYYKRILLKELLCFQNMISVITLLSILWRNQITKVFL